MAADPTPSVFDSLAYKRSRAAYVAQCTLEYFISILVTDAFLAKLLTHVGISDSVIGIISSLISFAFLFQLLAILLMTRLKNTKRTVILFDALSQVFFIGVYLVPFIPASVPVKTVLVIAAVMLAYLFKYLISSLAYKWGNSFVNPFKRGTFSAGKEMVSLICGIVFTLVTGWVVDRYEGLGNLQGAFIFIAIAMLGISILNFISFLLIKNEEPEQTAQQRRSLREVLANTLGNKKFIHVIIMSALWDIGRYTCLGFMGTFKTTDLMLSVGAVQVINMAANLCRMLISKPFGRFSDRTSYAKGFRMAMLMAGAAFAVNIFTTPSTWWLIILHTVLLNASYAGSNQNSFNITYSYVDSDFMVQALAIKSSICGVLGFGASLVGGWILQQVQEAGNMFLGIPMYGQQLLSLIALIFTAAAYIYTKTVIEKQNRMIQ